MLVSDPKRSLPFHNNPLVTLVYSPATPILDENPALMVDACEGNVN